MTYGDSFIAYLQHQEYLANQKFERENTYFVEPIVCEDAYVTEEEMWEELCRQRS